MTSRLTQLRQAGQAPWLDFVDRSFLNGGGLRHLIDVEGLTGVTSNPAIFEKAMGNGDAYDQGFVDFLAQGDAAVERIYEHEAVADIIAAAAELRSVYDATDGRDGYVSLEVSPYIADDAELTVREAHRLWAAVRVPCPSVCYGRRLG